jgi:opacity protein-like surface antigen
MKRILIGAVAVLLLIAANGMALAQERTEVEVGLKMWINDWTEDAPGFLSNTSDSTVLLGPAIEVKLPNYFFLEASYLFSTADYDFPDTGDKIERQDLDAAIGYMIVPGFGVLAGYKDASFKNRDLGFTFDLYGPVIGIIGIAQVDPYLSFYGRLDYLFTKFKTDNPLNPFPREDNPGWMFELGVKYAFTREFSGSIGYKYETYEGNDSDITDTFSGLTLSGMVAF